MLFNCHSAKQIISVWYYILKEGFIEADFEGFVKIVYPV